MRADEFGDMIDRVNDKLDDAKEQMAQDLYGRSRRKCLEEGVCVQCGNDAKEFRNEISEREFKLTAWCQKCQDDFFGED